MYRLIVGYFFAGFGYLHQVGGGFWAAAGNEKKTFAQGGRVVSRNKVRNQ